MRPILLALLVGCGPGAKDPHTGTAPGTASGTTTGTTTTTTCTCRSAIIDIAITRDGVPAVPDALGIAYDGGTRTDICGGAATACTETTWALYYLDESCAIDATLGSATLTARCEDHLLGPAVCVCGQDADIDLDFSASTTAR